MQAQLRDDTGLPAPIRELEEPARLIGQTFDHRYRIVDLIGRGGMSVVYRAIQLSAQDVVALKIMTRSFGEDDRTLQRFNQEALASSRLRHPNTIKVYDYGQSEDGYLFIAMEYLEGRTLADELKVKRRIDARRLCAVAVQVCRSLSEAHRSHCIVHRDLKPDNVFLLDRPHPDIPGVDMVKVLDFGIAKFMAGGVQSPSLTRTGFICGTPLYIAPEQGLDDDIDHRSDLYSLGVMLFEALAGIPPFRADTPIGVVLKHINDPPPDLRALMGSASLPRSLEELVFALLEKDPANRPSSAEDVQRTLEGMLRDDQFGTPETARLADGDVFPDPEDESPTRIIVAADVHPGGNRVASMPSNERPTMFIAAEKMEAARTASGAPPPPPRSAIHPRGVPAPDRTMPQPIGVLPLPAVDIVDPRETRAEAARVAAAKAAEARARIAYGGDRALREGATELIAAAHVAALREEAQKRKATEVAPPMAATGTETAVPLPTGREKAKKPGTRRSSRVSLIGIALLAAVGSMVGAYWMMKVRSSPEPAPADVGGLSLGTPIEVAPTGEVPPSTAARATPETAAAAEAPPAAEPVDLGALVAAQAAAGGGGGAVAADGEEDAEATPQAEAPAASAEVHAAAPAPQALAGAPLAGGAPAKAEQRPLSVTVVSQPPGAVIFMGDKELGKSPLPWAWEGGDQVELRAVLPGHVESKRTLARAELRDGQRVELALLADSNAPPARVTSGVEKKKVSRPAGAKAPSPPGALTTARPEAAKPTQAAQAEQEKTPKPATKSTRSTKTTKKIDWKEW